MYEILFILAGLSFGNTPILSALLRNQNVSSLEQVFIRSLIASIFGFAVIISFYINKKFQIIDSLSFTNQFYYIFQAILLNLMILVYFIAISLDTPAGEAALLVQIHPILTIILGALLLHEKIEKNRIISLIIALFGILILIRPWEANAFFTHIVGDIFAMLNGVFYSFYLIVGRHAKDKRMSISPLLSIAFVLVWAFIMYIPMLLILTNLPLPAVINSFSFSVYSTSFIIIIGILLGLLGSVLPYGLIMIGSRHVESSRQAILVLGEPLGAIIFGFLILSEPITVFYILGGGLIIFAVIYLAISGSKPISKVNLVVPPIIQEESSP